MTTPLSDGPVIETYELGPLTRRFSPWFYLVLGGGFCFEMLRQYHQRPSNLAIMMVTLILPLLIWHFVNEVQKIEIHARRMVLFRRFSDTQIDFRSIERIEVWLYRGVTIRLQFADRRRCQFSPLFGSSREVPAAIVEGCVRNGNHSFTRNFTLPDEPRSPDAETTL